jgi:nucleotide-binding universal stress UspA family protein
METRKMVILVGVDFSGSSLRAMAEAVRLSRKTGALLEVVHITASPVAAPIDLVDAPPSDKADLGDAERRLAELCAIATADLAPARAHFGLGDAAKGLCDAIDELRPDLVIVGSRGHGPVMRALLGSVSETVWRHSAVPVVIAPPSTVALRTDVPRPATAKNLAWSCARCGHIRKPEEGPLRCGGCGASPTRWSWAPVFEGPADALEPAIGTALGEEEDDTSRTGADNTTSALFSVTAPGGGPTDINPELRVRY